MFPVGVPSHQEVPADHHSQSGEPRAPNAMQKQILGQRWMGVESGAAPGHESAHASSMLLVQPLHPSRWSRVAAGEANTAVERY